MAVLGTSGRMTGWRHDHHRDARPDRAGRRRRRRRPGQPAAEPLRLATFNALENTAAELVALTDPAHAGRARAVLVEARGKVVSGGVDVTFFRDIAEGPEPVRRGADLWTRLLRVAQTFEDLPVPDGLRRPRAHAHRGLRAGAGLRHPAGRREGLVRAGGDRRRPHAVDGWPAAAGRARRPGAGPGADLHRRAVPGRRPGALERGQPGAARRGLRRGRPRLRPPGRGRARRSRTRRPSGWSPRRCARAPARPTRWCPRSPARCSPPRTCAARSPPSSPTAGEGDVHGTVIPAERAGCAAVRHGYPRTVSMSRPGRQGRGFLPDTSPGAPAPEGSASREASARAAAQDAAPHRHHRAGPVRATITVPDSVSMVAPARLRRRAAPDGRGRGRAPTSTSAATRSRSPASRPTTPSPSRSSTS